MRPHYISFDVWQSLGWKEQDYISLLQERKWTKSEIKRKLYITTDEGYRKLQKRVVSKIGNCVGVKTLTK